MLKRRAYPSYFSSQHFEKKNQNLNTCLNVSFFTNVSYNLKTLKRRLF